MFIRSVILLALCTPLTAMQPEDCPSSNGPFTATGVILQGSGKSQTEAILDVYGDGGDQSLIDESGVTCSGCPAGSACDTFVGLDGVIGTPTYKVRRNAQGEIIEWIAFVTYSGSYSVECLQCE